MNLLKNIAQKYDGKFSYKLRKYLIYKLFYASLLKKGNKIKAYFKLAGINYFLKKFNKLKSPQHLIFLAVSALRPPL